MRVLFADDQIPDDDIPDDQIFEELKRRYPKAQDGFIRAFQVMRRVQRAISEDNEVTVARQHAEALSLARSMEFDVAIIDLGWYADEDLKDDRAVAGWTIAKALDDAAVEHPERSSTAQIMYSARFDNHPELGQIAANKGRLPIAKPYQERHTIPLEEGLESAGTEDRVRAACQSLRATLSFIDHVRARSGAQDLEPLRRAASDGLDRAIERERRWDVLTRVLLALSVIIVLVGIVSLFFLGVPQGAVTAASGVIIGLIPRLMYGQLKETRDQIQLATNRLDALVTQARDLGAESSVQVHRPPGRPSSTR